MQCSAKRPHRFNALKHGVLSRYTVRVLVALVVGDDGDEIPTAVGVVVRIDKDKADIGHGLDLILLGAVNIGHEINQNCALRSGFFEPSLALRFDCRL